MKQITSLIFLFSISILFGCQTIAQKIHTDDHFRHLIGNTFKVGTDPEGLHNYEYVGGSVLTPLDVENMVLSTEYRYGKNILITFSRMKNPDDELYVVEEVLHIKNLHQSWVLKTGLCRLNQVDDAAIISIVKPGKLEYYKDVKKAWRFVWQTLKLEEIPAKNVDCLNEGFDLTSL